MEDDKKECVYQAFIIALLLLTSIFILYISHDQSTSLYSSSSNQSVQDLSQGAHLVRIPLGHRQ